MNSSGNSVTACRLCQHYSPEGRRGGYCGKLDVPVLSQWDACSLASHPFETSWLSANDLNTLLYDSVHDNVAITHLDSGELQEINRRSLSLAEY
jgi:hypothetical protein